ncbi:MAG: hemerythrin domain-containing protein [Sphingomicrobium sp.]
MNRPIVSPGSYFAQTSGKAWTMARTSIMRAQHDHAEKLIDELFERIDRHEALIAIGKRAGGGAIGRDAGGGGGADAYPLSLCLAKIAGVLRTHFAIEDQVLYPALIASPDRQVAVTARVFEREMGHIADQFERFVQRWGRSTEIGDAIPQFRYECDMMFSALRERIGRENRELYPLADRAEAPDPIRAEPPIAPRPDPIPESRAPRHVSRPFEGFVLRGENAA